MPNYSTRTVFLAFILIGGALIGWDGPASAEPGAPSHARPADDWNTRFEGKSGWVGGDCVYSLSLPDHRILWLFGDTLLGAVKDGGRPGAKFINNTVGIQATGESDCPIRFIAGKTNATAAASFIIPAGGKGWFWPMAPVMCGDRLLFFLQQIDKTKDPGVLGFKQVGQTLAVVDNPADDPEQWHITQHLVPHSRFGKKESRCWGSAILPHGRWAYLYGYDEKPPADKHLILARAPLAHVDDFSTWQFRTATAWSDSPDDVVPLADGLATEFSVNAASGDRGLMLLYTDHGLSDKILARYASLPEGPWSAPTLLYTCPEMAKDKGVFSYAAKAHEWASKENAILVSYCVNTWDFGRLFRDERVYRPKFVRIELK